MSGTLVRSDPVPIYLIKTLFPHAVNHTGVLDDDKDVALVDTAYIDEIHRVIPQEFEDCMSTFPDDQDSDLDEGKQKPKPGKKMKDPEESDEEKPRLAAEQEEWVRNNREKIRQRDMKTLKIRMQMN